MFYTASALRATPRLSALRMPAVRASRGVGTIHHEVNKGPNQENKELKNSNKPKAEIEEGTLPRYNTTFDDRAQDLSQRMGRKGEGEHGVRPTKFQRQMMVFTRMYTKQSDIPEFVPADTMNRFSDRLRASGVLLGVLTTLTLWVFYGALYRRKMREYSTPMTGEKM